MRMRRLSLLSLLAAGSVQAAPLTVVRQDMVYDLNADGTYTSDVLLVQRVNEAAVVAPMGQFQLPFTEGMEQADILEAYTTTRDGQRIDVAADKIVVQQSPAGADAPLFGDLKIKALVFPQVDVGATLSVHYRYGATKTKLPNVFSTRLSFNLLRDYDSVSITVRAPEKLALRVAARGVEGGSVKASKPGTHEWHWTYGGAKGVPAEPNSVSLDDISPYIELSTLKDYPALAAAYLVGGAPAAKVTPAVQKLSDEITTGITDKRAQTEAIYRWVSTNVRYVAIYMGAGGLVPHNADEIIAARYGDCKDKTTLLTALLNAKGVRSIPVLVNAANSYTLPDTPVVSAFNHAITWLPDYKLFVDSTSGFARFGMLTDGVYGKQALITGDAGQKAQLASLPNASPAADRLVTRTTAVLAADGTVTGSNVSEASGLFEPGLRAALGRVPATQLPMVAQAMLAAAGQNGEAKLTLSDMRDLTLPMSFAAEFKTPMRVTLPGPGALVLSYGIPPLASMQALIAQTMQIERKLDFNCPGGALEEQLKLTLPAGVKITTLPKAADIQSPMGRYSASYELKDNLLTVSRKLELTQPRTVCTGSDSAELRRFATAVNQEMRAQVLYQ